jgi:hypothetical protein
MPTFFTHDRITGKHHQKTGIWTHYPTSCNVHDVGKVRNYLYYVPDNSEYVTRLFHSNYGLGVIFYELVGKMTFVAQISATRVAWQRLDWETGYLLRWDENQIQGAINNFLWVADCEEAKAWLDRN